MAYPVYPLLEKNGRLFDPGKSYEIREGWRDGVFGYGDECAYELANRRWSEMDI